MLSVECKDVWVEPVLVSKDLPVSKVIGFFKDKNPVVVEETGAIVSEHKARFAKPETHVHKISVKVSPVEPETPVFVAAQQMIKHDVHAVPVRSGRKPKYVTYHSVLGATQTTKHLAKREARTIMNPGPVITEKNASNAMNIAQKNRTKIIPIVNKKGKLISMWFLGSIHKTPRFVKEGTRLKLIINKLAKGPVIVVNNHREPVGTIGVDEVLEISAMYKEFSAPLYYSGLEILADATQKKVKGMIEDTVKKIGDMIPVHHSTVYLKKKGTWSVKVKVSTQVRTFIWFKEGKDMMGTFNEVLSGIFEEVKSEKEKMTEFKKLSRK